MAFEIFKNKREANGVDIQKIHSCSFCKKYTSVMVALRQIDSFTIGPNYFRGAPKICKSCLERFSKAIDDSIISNLKKEFEKRR